MCIRDRLRHRQRAARCGDRFDSRPRGTDGVTAGQEGLVSREGHGPAPQRSAAHGQPVGRRRAGDPHHRHRRMSPVTPAFVAYPRGPRYAAIGFSLVLVVGAITAFIALGAHVRSKFTVIQVITLAVSYTHLRAHETVLD